MLKLPETFLLCSTALLLTDHVVTGWVFFGLSMLGALTRFGLESNAAKEISRKNANNLDQIVNSINSIMTQSMSSKNDMN